MIDIFLTVCIVTGKFINTKAEKEWKSTMTASDQEPRWTNDS